MSARSEIFTSLFVIIFSEVICVISSELLQEIKNGLEPGYYTFSWDAAAYSSGIYLIQFRISDIIKTYRVLLLK